MHTTSRRIRHLAAHTRALLRASWPALLGIAAGAAFSIWGVWHYLDEVLAAALHLLLRLLAGGAR